MADKILGTKELAAAAIEAYNKFTADRGADSLRKLYDTLYDLNAALREEMQKNTLQPIKLILAKLDKGTPLTPDDRQIIRLWLVGDAEAYSSRENDYNNWTAELTRLMTAISQTAGQIADVRGNMAVQGTITDALGVIPSMQKFLEALDRVKRFENSTRTMDSGTMLAIKALLENKIKSPND